MSSKKIGETSYKETAFGIIPRSKLISLEIFDFPPIELKIEPKVNRKKYVESLKFADNNNYEN